MKIIIIIGGGWGGDGAGEVTGVGRCRERGKTQVPAPEATECSLLSG